MSNKRLRRGTILVTGGAGFIGSSFVRQRVAAGDLVVTLDKLTYAGNLDSLASIVNSRNHIFEVGDIGDYPKVTALLDRYLPCSVVNFAAESHVDRSIENPKSFAQTNVLGTCELLMAVRAYWEQLPMVDRKRFRFLQISTDEVYGSLGRPGRASETSLYAPNSPYAASKAAADHFVRAFHRTYGLPVLTTNCSNNYGPFQFPEKLVPLMILNAIERRRLPVYGDGHNVRDWLYVDDHCRAIQLVLERGTIGQAYNIGGDSERTNLSVVREICKIVDKLYPDSAQSRRDSLIQFVPDRPGHDRRYAVDSSKLRRELGWKPRESFDSGLEKTVAWYCRNTTWVEHLKSGTYGQERLRLAKGACCSD